MSWVQRYRPSLGFGLLLASWASLAGLLGWGFSPPELDRVWWVVQRMKLDDFSGLTEAEAELITRAVQRRPELAAAFAGGSRPVGVVEPTQQGWTSLRHFHVVVHTQPPAPLRVSVECRGPAAAFPATVSFAADAFRQRIECPQAGRHSFDLPAPLTHPPRVLRGWAQPSATASGSACARFQLRITGKIHSAGRAAP